MKQLLFSGLAVFTLVAPVAAADMTPIYQYSPPPPPPAVLWSWTGMYFGANSGWISSAGGGQIASTGTDTGSLGLGALLNNNAIPRIINLGFGGFIGGGQVGYNWQINQVWMLGVETDFDWEAGGGTSTGSDVGANSFGLVSMIFNRQLDTLGTARGRIGYILAPDQLWYFTGGAAFAETKVGATFICSACKPSPALESGTASQTSSVSAGWTVGAGMEWKFAPSWSLKAEYLYVSLGSPSNTLRYTYASQISTLTSTFNERDNVLRVGINYKLF
jgi:outer membrane immunogenic protein